MTQQPSVEQAVRARVAVGQRMPTPTGRGQFSVAAIDQVGVVLLLGVKEAPTRLTWQALEGVPRYVRGRGRVPIGSKYDVTATEGTLDAYLKQHVNRATAGWVAVLLERAGVLHIDRNPPATVRLADDWHP